MSAYTYAGPQSTASLVCPLCGGPVVAHSGGICQCRDHGHWSTLDDARGAAAHVAEVRAAQATLRRYQELTWDARAELQHREQVSAAAERAWQDARADAERARRVAQQYEQLSEQARQYLDYQVGLLDEERALAAAAPTGQHVAPARPATTQVAPTTSALATPTPVVSAVATPTLMASTAVAAPRVVPPSIPATPREVWAKPPRRLPTAVILQGTGALMILAATVLAFGIAWTILPPGGQSALMVLTVLVLGGITVGLRHRLPTTSLILAALTAAVAVAVASFLPFVAGFTSRWYPALAAAVVTVTLALAGKFANVLVWRHLAWAGVAVTSVIWAGTVFGELSDANGAALSTLMWAAGSVALLSAGKRMRRSDAETANSAYWSGLALGGLTCLAAIGTLGMLAMVPGSAPRILPGFAIAAIIPVLFLVLPRALRPFAFLPTSLALDVLLTPALLDSPVPALVLPLLLAIQLAFGLWGQRRGVDAVSTGAWVTASIGAAALTVAFLVSAAGPSQMTMLWLTVVASAIVVGAVMIAAGRQAAVTWLAYSGLAVASAAWLWTYAAQHLPAQVEFFTVPVLAAVVGTQLLMRRALWPLPAVMAAALLALPSYQVALSDWAVFDSVNWTSWVCWVAILTGALVLGWRRPPSRTLVGAEAVLGLMLFAMVTAANSGLELPEVYIALGALALTACLSIAHVEGYLPGKFTSALVGAAVMLTGSYGVALFGDVGVAETWWRRGVVLVVLVGVTVGLRRVAVWWSVGCAWAGLVLAGVWWVQWLAGNGWVEALEVWSVPLAVVATVGVWWTRGVAGWPRWSLVVPAGVALAVSVVATFVQPLGLAGPVGTLRVLLVLAVLWASVALLWTRPKWSLAVGAGALVATWYQFAFAVANSSWNPAFEVYTWSAAALVAALTLMALRLPHGRINTSITMAPAMTLLLIPTAAAFWLDDALWRIVFIIFVGGALLTLAAMQGWAGMLWPSLLAIAIVLLPILSVLMVGIPVFIPLTLMGVVLILAGARVERLRLQGRHLAHWATHLH